MALSLRPLQPEIYPQGSFRIPHGEHTLRVGRKEGSDLRVEHASVSSHHADLSIMGGTWVEVVDHGSSNGTFVNGVRVDRRLLVEGDLLAFSAAEFWVETFAASGSEFPGEANPALDRVEVTEPLKLEDEAPESTQEADLLRLAEEEVVNLRTALDEERGTHEAIRTKLTQDGEQLRAELETGQIEKVRLSERLVEQDREIDQLKREIESARLAAIEFDTRIKEQDEQIRRLGRDLEEAALREQRIQASLSEARREVIAREGDIAGLRYEIGTKEGILRQIEEQSSRLQGICDDHEITGETLRNELTATQSDLDETRIARAEAERKEADVLGRLSDLGKRLVADWRFFGIPAVEAETSETGEVDRLFARVGGVADKIRRELDLIEPIWGEFGEGVQAELARRCENLRQEGATLDAETQARRETLAAVESDLTRLRELMDVEVRRAQGLSRRGIEVEIPERFETMIIARDREQEIYRALVERIEALDQHLEGYKGSRKFADVFREMGEFRTRLAAIIESGGVRSFEVAVGTLLTPKHRREVQILSRKGWGTRQYSDYPFQPGEVTKVIRTGYRVGEGDDAVILRKVEVLIRGVGD